MPRVLLLLSLFSLALACADDEFTTDLLECGASQPCNSLSYQSYDTTDPDSIPSSEDLQCAIDVIDARESALLVVSDGCEGYCSGSLYLIRSDGTALRQGWTQDFGPVDVPGYAGSTVADWATQGQICDLVEPGTCTPQTCDYPSDWFVNCRAQDSNRCEP